MLCAHLQQRSLSCSIYAPCVRVCVLCTRARVISRSFLGFCTPGRVASSLAVCPCNQGKFLRVFLWFSSPRSTRTHPIAHPRHGACAWPCPRCRRPGCATPMHRVLERHQTPRARLSALSCRSSMKSLVSGKRMIVEGWGDGVGEGDKCGRCAWARVRLRIAHCGAGGTANSLVRYVYGVTERHPLQYILGISRLPTRATVHGARTSTALFKRGKPLRASSMQSGGVRRWRGAHQRQGPRALFVRRPRRPRPSRAGFWGGLKL